MQSEIINIITNVGFPITACLLLCWYVKFITEQNNKTVEDMRKEHRDEVSKMVEALQNNTLAIQRLIDKLDGNEG